MAQLVDEKQVGVLISTTDNRKFDLGEVESGMILLPNFPRIWPKTPPNKFTLGENRF